MRAAETVSASLPKRDGVFPPSCVRRQRIVVESIQYQVAVTLHCEHESPGSGKEIVTDVECSPRALKRIGSGQAGTSGNKIHIDSSVSRAADPSGITGSGLPASPVRSRTHPIFDRTVWTGRLNARFDPTMLSGSNNPKVSAKSDAKTDVRPDCRSEITVHGFCHWD